MIIQGTVIGNIKAKRSIEIHAPGRVKGDLHTPSLQIDKGVIFEGRSFMEAATGRRAPPPAGPAAAAAREADARQVAHEVASIRESSERGFAILEPSASRRIVAAPSRKPAASHR